jgi:hypothetical protein
MVLAPLAIPLAVLLAGLVLLALARTAQAWARPLVEIITANHHNLIVHILTLPVRLITRVVLPGVNYVTHKLTVAASHYMHPVAHWFDALSAFALGSAVAVGLFAERTALAFERLTTHVIPREIGRAVRPVERKALKALGLAGLTAAALHHLARQLRHAIYHDVLPRLHHLAHAIDVTIPRELGRIRTRAGRLERELTHPSTRWLRRIAGAMWVATLAGLMIRTLARRFPWLFCRKVKNVGNRVCGLDAGLLGSLLTDTLIIGGTISVVEFARELQAIEGEAVGLIRGFIREA